MWWSRCKNAFFGTVIDVKPNPTLDGWAESFFTFVEKIPSVCSFPRDATESAIQGVTDALAGYLGMQRQRTWDYKLQQEQKLDMCIKGCIAAFSPDVDLHIGSDHLPVSGKILTAKSPVFEAMLKEGSPMKEAATRRVELPKADAETVRALLCQLLTDGACLDALGLNAESLLNILSLAAEWQCTEIQELLIKNSWPGLKNANQRVALACLKVSSAHASSTAAKEWSKLQALSAARVAETCSGNLESLIPCSFEAVSAVLACNELDTSDREGCVLKFVAEWVQTHGNTKLASLLELVRFPLLRLTSLNAEEKDAMQYFSEHAGPQLRRLIGEASMLQSGRKRPREESEDSAAYERRATKRVCSGDLPTLSEEDLGGVICGVLW
eukprot:gnl/MRDRNA2_/MRDRNA2_126439_c0_seq1.p1 gnl/MRDRNA2_/MRDRNA2_126439_c0~~gnl/MRDRNA2_/MRDRNA2_126439_c0_seq1.p1  ORF type:complete len:383 (-),score=62.34 gnl/MRDRNA2_/MRDRNA2_126439_c0_seq1:322-1470(-)